MDKIVLICATGRSGSTTMQRILNTIPNSNICGENFGAVNSLLEFYKRIKITTYDYVPGHLTPTSYDEIVVKNIKPAWYNSYDFKQTVRMIKKMIINLFKKDRATKLWGFKEIRYYGGDMKYITEFKELFPQTKVIIQIRENTIAQSNSGWHKDDEPAIAIDNITSMNNELITFYNGNKSYCYLTSFESMFDKENMKKLFTFIGFEKDYDENKIDEILNNNVKD
jgi:hypothetical protein